MVPIVPNVTQSIGFGRGIFKVGWSCVTAAGTDNHHAQRETACRPEGTECR